MASHIIAKFYDHDSAEVAAVELEKEFPGQVSISSARPKERWWEHERWIEVPLETIGGLAATVANLIPGFGVLFTGGPLDGALQGRIMADWVAAHPHHEAQDHIEPAFVIVEVVNDEETRIRSLLEEHGGQHIHGVGHG